LTCLEELLGVEGSDDVDVIDAGFSNLSRLVDPINNRVVVGWGIGALN